MAPVGDDRFDKNERDENMVAENADVVPSSEDQTPQNYDPTPDYDPERLRQFTRDGPSQTGPRRTGWITALVGLNGVLVLGGLGYWYFAFWKYLPDPDTGPPLVVAKEGPVRVKPDDPGGLDIPHQDKLIYGHLDPDGAPQETVERLLPPPEIPVSPVIAKGETDRKTARIVADMPEHITPPDLPVSSDVSDVAPPILPQTSPSDTSPDEQPTAEKTPSSSKHPKSVSPAGDSLAEKQSTQQDQLAVVPGPEFFRVQLGAFRSDTAAQNGWKALSKEFSGILSGLKGEIVRADLEEQGVYYRIQVGRLEKEAAQKICRQLSAQKKECLVVKR